MSGDEQLGTLFYIFTIIIVENAWRERVWQQRNGLKNKNKKIYGGTCPWIVPGGMCLIMDYVFNA